MPRPARILSRLPRYVPAAAREDPALADSAPLADWPVPAGRPARQWLYDWLALLGVLLIAAVPLVVEPNARDTRRVMENVCVGSSQETWLRIEGHRGYQPFAESRSTRPGAETSG